MAAGLSRGPRTAVIPAPGCALGILPYMLAAITGLAALLHTSAAAFVALGIKLAFVQGNSVS
ncbi:LysE family transporter [Pseudomonas synxantha]|uniref:LysE family transporter n=1 Tax=Pseudomonas synxantha TaxID=47883 RepID=UPI000F55EE0C